MLPGNIQDIFGSLVVGIFFFLISIIIYHTIKSIFKWNDYQHEKSFRKWLREKTSPIKTFVGMVLLVIFYAVGILTEDITDSITEGDKNNNSNLFRFILFDFPKKKLGKEYENRLQAILKENGDFNALGKGIIKNDSLINLLAKKYNTTGSCYKQKYVKRYYRSRNKSDLEGFINDVYFLSKNWAYSQDTYFNELELVQNRINLGQGLFYLSYWFSLLMLLIILVLPCIYYSTGRTIFSRNFRCQSIKLFVLLIILIAVCRISFITYKNSEKLHSQRAIGYFSTYLRLGDKYYDNNTP